MSPRRLIRRILLVGALLVAGILVAYSTMVFADPESKLLGSYFALFIATLGIFLPAVLDFKPSWSKPRFWATVAGLLGLHLYGCFLLLRAVPQWRGIWFVLLVVVEFPVLGAILDRSGFRSTPSSKE